MVDDSVKVVVDVMEPAKVPDAFKAIPEVDNVMLAPLESADIIIEGVGFERKTWNDYRSSIQEGRIQQQAEKMTEVFGVSYVLIEGDMAGSKSKPFSAMLGSSVRGHMASLTAREKYGVVAAIPCGNTALLADYAVRLARKHISDPKAEWIDTGPIDVKEPTTKRIYACVEGVGPDTAERLYEAYPSLPKLQMILQTNNITQIEGIGPETEKALKEALL